MILNRQEIEALIQEKALVSDFIDLQTQLNPNGFDITVAAVFQFEGTGSLDFSNKERNIPEAKEIPAQRQKPQDTFGWWHLKRGAYKIRTNETVHLPLDLVALAYSRSSLLRVGAFTQHAVWDAGFRGKSEFILFVENEKGLLLKQNARIAQLVFIRMRQVNEGYKGRYQDT
ncbi:MAG: deoxyuridine 5'-triphosphate nucleotidohydrolase [Candidatus Omnitrophota bacterium]|jgi:dUTP pyrophosphatase|nr:MAG: deoxyuridine 5'-triphosphate nucleotidohydrolase [Candidatus Omnitrophota bacterium]